MNKKMNELKEKSLKFYENLKDKISKDKRRAVMLAGAFIVVIAGVGTVGYLYTSAGKEDQRVSVVGEDTVALVAQSGEKPENKKQSEDVKKDQKKDKANNTKTKKAETDKKEDASSKQEKAAASSDKKQKENGAAEKKTSSSTNNQSAQSSKLNERESKSTQSTTSSQSSKPAQPSTPTQPSKPTQPDTTAQPTKPVETKPVEPKPAEPEKPKTPIYGTKQVWVEDKPAWTETIDVPVYETQYIMVFADGVECTGWSQDEINDYMEEHEVGWRDDVKQVLVRTDTQTVYHDAEGHWETVEDKNNIVGWK